MNFNDNDSLKSSNIFRKMSGLEGNNQKIYNLNYDKDDCMEMKISIDPGSSAQISFLVRPTKRVKISRILRIKNFSLVYEIRLLELLSKEGKRFLGKENILN